MTTMTVYDPPLCCSTGVCGPEVDPKLAQFAGDLEWLKTLGVTVHRFNLAQEPERFVENREVQAILHKSDGDELPAILVGDTLVCSGRFPGRGELAAMTGLSMTDSAAESGGPGDNDQSAGKPEESSGGCCGSSTTACC